MPYYPMTFRLPKQNSLTMFASLIGLFLFLIFATKPCQADMLISPTRVLLEQGNQNASVTLHNPSNGPRTYALEWAEQHMTEDGTWQTSKEGDFIKSPPSSPYIRLSPRRIVVPAKGFQTVRVSYRANPDMKPGEYRSHLLFRIIATESEPSAVTTIAGEDGISVNLKMQMSLAIPVVVRHLVAERPVVKISRIEVMPITGTAPQNPEISVSLQQSGLSSSYGRLVVEMKADEKSPPKLIGISNHLSVYPDSSLRRVFIPLTERNIPAGAKLRIAYEGIGEYQGSVWDEQILQVR